MKKSMEQLLILGNSGLTLLLAELLDSPIKENKEIAKECHPSDEDEQQLYYSCRQTLVSILKSIAFSNRTKYFGIASHLIVGLYKFVSEIADTKLRVRLRSIYQSPTSKRGIFRNLKRDLQEFALFSLHLLQAIEDHLREKDLSLPVNLEDLQEGDNPHYLVQIFLFHCDLSCLVTNLDQGLHCLEEAIRDAGGVAQHFDTLRRWRRTSFSGFSRASPCNKLSYQTLKEGDEHLWLLKYDSAIDFESRRHLMLMMFPEVQDDNEKLHKLLIDRSSLFKESFELIAHVKPKSLHSGLFVEFKDGYGSWCPAGVASTACPEDRHRFFPNPAQLKPEQLNLFGFCGRVIALALMHQVQVGIVLDLVFFLQLAEEELSLEDIRCADPIMYKSWKRILEMDADFVDSDAMGLTFVREIDESGSRKTVELCPGGDNIVVNSKNREQYVHLLIQHLFVKSISAKVAYFARGFADILCKRRLAKCFFQAIDLKALDCALVGGDIPILLEDWKAHTKYEGYRQTDEQICWFWKVVEGMSMEQQRELLFFWTSVKYLPVIGFSGLPYPLTIYKTSGSDERLPSAHTCFFRLSLPHYVSLASIQRHLSFICQRHVGCSFGFV